METPIGVEERSWRSGGMGEHSFKILQRVCLPFWGDCSSWRQGRDLRPNSSLPLCPHTSLHPLTHGKSILPRGRGESEVLYI